MKKRHLFIIFYIYLLYLLGCGSDVTQNTAKAVKINCGNNKNARFQYFYMHQNSPHEDWPAYCENKFKDAFDLRANINVIMRNSVGTQIPYEIINTYTGSLSDIIRGLGEFYIRYYDPNNSNYPFFICGCDSISANTYNPGSWGHSGTSFYSYVLTGWIYKKSFWAARYADLAELTSAHEFGHQLGVFDEGDSCSGRYAIDSCAMHSFNSFQKQFDPFISFCDFHGCKIYRGGHKKFNIQNTEGAGNNEKIIVANTGNLLQNSNFSVQLLLDRDLYYENQAAILNIKVKNLGSTVDSIQNCDTYGFATHIKLKDQFGNQIKYSSLTSSRFPSYTSFKPEEEKYFSFDIIRTHGSETIESEDMFNNKFLPEGRYIIELTLDDSYFGNHLSALSTQVDISKPTGEEKIALNELTEVYKVKDLVKRSLKYKEFAQNHLESVYMEQAFSDYLSIGVSKHIEKYYEMVLKDCEWFINLRPNSLYMRDILNGCLILIEKYKNKSEEIFFLNKIINQNSNTKASNEAKILLQKLLN